MIHSCAYHFLDLGMCDSHISESCPMDFTNYCPVDSVCSEGRYKRPTHKSQAKNHIAWFGRKTKGASSHNKELMPSKQDVGGKLLQECNVHPICEAYGCSSCEAYGCSSCCHGYSRSNSKQAVDYSSNEDCTLGGSNGRALEKASRYVSQEELDALKGCVTRRRAVFSPSPSSSPVHSYVQLKSQHSPALTNSLPVGGKHRFRVEEFGHVRQSSLEYDHLKDFDPLVPVSNGDSVCVQFRLQNGSDGEDGATCKMCHHSNSMGSKKRSVSNTESPFSYSIPERLDCDACDGQGNIASGNSDDPVSCSCDMLSLQVKERCHAGVCNSWPRNELLIKETTEPQKHGKTVGASLSPLSVKSNRIQQQQQYHSPLHSRFNSPLHSRFNSPLLQPKHQVYPNEGGMGGLKTCDTGSNYSLYSQTTTVSSLTDRQHCSYSKGVDGNMFKTRSDVSSLLRHHIY